VRCSAYYETGVEILDSSAMFSAESVAVGSRKYANLPDFTVFSVVIISNRIGTRSGI